MIKKPLILLKLLRDKSGTAFVEFGILASIFFTLSFAIIDFGLMMWLNSTVEHVATEGARYAAVRGAGKASPTTAAQIITYVEDRADGIPAADMTVNVTWPGWPGTVVNPPAGSTVTVLVTYNYEYIIGGILGFDPVDLQGRSTMIVN
jgi:Flp pilus assembly protein TadG